MVAGRPKQADPGTLYAFAHQFYWDFRGLAEGYPRWRFDQKQYEQSAAALANANLQIRDEQKTRLAELVEEEIRSGHLKKADKEDRLRYVEDAEMSATREWLHHVAAQKARKQLRVPGEPEVLEELLKANTPQAVRQICKDAANWPISSGSVLPLHLSEQAQEFVAAKNDPRFPRSTRRPSSHLKQLWFLSRALAGAIFGVKTRTAINLVGSKRPEEIFEESRAAKPARKRRKAKGSWRQRAWKRRNS